MKCNKAVSIFIQTQVSIALHALDFPQVDHGGWRARGRERGDLCRLQEFKSH